MVCVEEEYTGLLLQQGGDITVCSNVVSVPIESLSITHIHTHLHLLTTDDHWQSVISSRLPVFLLLLVQMFNLVMQKECL